MATVVSSLAVSPPPLVAVTATRMARPWFMWRIYTGTVRESSQVLRVKPLEPPISG
jgi:hypothetical protein